MLSSMRTSLAAAGVYVEREVRSGRLELSADRHHMAGGHFDSDAMLTGLEKALDQAVSDRYEGLWASGDMGWEMGPHLDHSGLLEYEQRLEAFLCHNPRFSGVCQYHVDSLPRAVVRHGLLSHSSIFVSENLSLHNPYFSHAESYRNGVASDILLDSAISRICTM